MIKWVLSIMLSIGFGAVVFGQPTYYLPGTGQSVKELHFEDSTLLGQKFNYGSGWAGSGFGLSGTQRGAPEIIEVIANPQAVASSGSYVLAFRSQARDSAWYNAHPSAVGTNVYGGPDIQEQDDFFMYSGSWVANDTPSVMMHVYLPDSAVYTSLRMTVKYNNSNTNSWPGIWNYGSTFNIRGPGRSDITVQTNAPNGGKNTWWTLGLSITPDGDIQYYATPSYVTQLTKDHCLGFNSLLSQGSNKPYFPVNESNDAIIMSSNRNLSSTSSLFDRLYYTKGAQVDTTSNVGISRKEMSSIRYYPNPVTDYLSVTGLNRTMDYKLLNNLGEVVKLGGVKSDKIDVRSLPNGIYILMLEEQKVGRVIKM